MQESNFLKKHTGVKINTRLIKCQIDPVSLFCLFFPDDCFPPCQNGGICLGDACQCPEQWVGEFCELKGCGIPPVVPHAIYNPVE